MRDGGGQDCEVFVCNSKQIYHITGPILTPLPTQKKLKNPQADIAEICEAPWCTRQSAKASGKTHRRIGRYELCRGCYQYLWGKAKQLGIDSKEMAIRIPSIEPPAQIVPVIEGAQCGRRGCTTQYKKGMKVRHVSSVWVCNPCFQAVHKYKQEKRITLETALKQYQPKGWRKPRPPVPEPVTCCMPWCEASFAPNIDGMLDGVRYVCGKCRLYLIRGMRARYPEKILSWQQWAEKALHGEVIAPNAIEQCSMPWCGVYIVPKIHYEGKALCDSCQGYFHMIARTRKMAKIEAWEHVFSTPPRLLHTRGRKSKKEQE